MPSNSKQKFLIFIFVIFVLTSFVFPVVAEDQENGIVKINPIEPPRASNKMLAFELETTNEILLSGINTDSATTYLTIIGREFNRDGSPLTNPSASSYSSTKVNVGDNGEWEYRWNIKDISTQLTPNLYDIFAKSCDSLELSDCKYDFISLHFTRSFMSIPTMPTKITQGDILIVDVNVKYGQQKVKIWIIGDTSFLIKDSSDPMIIIPGFLTENLDPGNYQIVIQHQGFNNKFDIYEIDDQSNPPVVTIFNRINSNNEFMIGEGHLMGSEAYESLTQLLDSLDHDDIYVTGNLEIEGIVTQVTLSPTPELTVNPTPQITQSLTPPITPTPEATIIQTTQAEVAVPTYQRKKPVSTPISTQAEETPINAMVYVSSILCAFFIIWRRK